MITDDKKWSFAAIALKKTQTTTQKKNFSIFLSEPVPLLMQAHFHMGYITTLKTSHLDTPHVLVALAYVWKCACIIWRPVQCPSLPPLSSFYASNCWQKASPVKPARAHAKVGLLNLKLATGDTRVEAGALLLVQSDPETRPGRGSSLCLAAVCSASSPTALWIFDEGPYLTLPCIISRALLGARWLLSAFDPSWLPARDWHPFRRRCQSDSPSFLLRHPHMLPVLIGSTWFSPWKEQTNKQTDLTLLRQKKIS